MKVALLIPDFSGGGAEPVMIRIADELARRGHDVELVAFRAEGVNAASIGDAVTVVDLGARSALSTPRRIARHLRRSRPDVVLAALTKANVALLLAKLLLGRAAPPVIVAEHASLSAPARRAGLRHRLVLLPLVRATYRLADRVIGCSKGVAEDVRTFLRLPADRVAHAYNPALMPDALERSLRAPERELVPTSDEPTIVSIGRLEPQKDHATLLEAFALVARERPARLLLLGDGSLRQDIERQSERLGLRDRVILGGHVPDPLPYLRTCDLLVLSSRYEGFGIVLVEALACGVPVVSTDCPEGPSEVLDGGRFGRLVPVGDSEALAAAMMEALDEPIDADACLARASEFSLERSADRYEEILRDAVAARTAG